MLDQGLLVIFRSSENEVGKGQGLADTLDEYPGVTGFKEFGSHYWNHIVNQYPDRHLGVLQFLQQQAHAGHGPKRTNGKKNVARANNERSYPDEQRAKCGHGVGPASDIGADTLDNV